MNVVAVHMHGRRQPVGRCVRQGQARQVEHVGEILAAQHEIKVERAQVKGLAHRDMRLQVDVGGRQVSLEGIRFAGFDGEQWTAVRVQGEGLLIERTSAADLEGRRVVLAGLIGGDQ